MAMQCAPMKVTTTECMWAEMTRFQTKIGAPPGLHVARDRRGSGTSSAVLSIPPPPGLGADWDTDSASGSDWSSSASDGGASVSGRSVSPVRLSMRETRTTLHIRNLPCYFTRSILLELLHAKGLSGEFDFLYLPMDFKTKQSIGYAFLNFRSSTAALLFRAALHGFSQWAVRSQKVCSVQWSQTQGLEANVKLIIKSRVLTKRCPEEFKPIVFADGHMVPFPGTRERL